MPRDEQGPGEVGGQEAERQEWLGVGVEGSEWAPEWDRWAELSPHSLAGQVGVYCDCSGKLRKGFYQFHSHLHFKKTLLAGRPVGRLLRRYQEREDGGLD